MSESISCYRCGTSLQKLTLPLSRCDECPQCTVHLHVCKMCLYYDPRVPRQCREDGAEEVKDKGQMNFCDWFKPSGNAFDPRRAKQESDAKGELEALFGGSDGVADDSGPDMNSAEELFK